MFVSTQSSRSRSCPSAAATSTASTAIARWSARTPSSAAICAAPIPVRAAVQLPMQLFTSFFQMRGATGSDACVG